MVAFVLTSAAIWVFPGITGMNVARAGEPRFTTSGLWVLDSQGRHLYPRGFDVSGAEYTPTGDPLSFGPSSFTAIRSTGATVVRLPIAWALIEPTPGRFDPAALARASQIIRWAGDAGLDVILDMHQYLWSPCLGGLGMPSWTVSNCPSTPPSNPLQQEVDVQVAADAFWHSPPLQAAFASMWARVVEAVGQPRYLIGYDILNEPDPGFIPNEVFETQYLTPFYREVGTAIRQVDPEGLLYVEPSILNDVVNGSSQFLGPIGLGGVVYEPHQYGATSENADSIAGVGAIDASGPDQFAYDLEVDKAVADHMGAALWLGEWGALGGSSVNYQPTSYVDDDLAEQDALMVPSAYWSYSVLTPQKAKLGLAGLFRRAEPAAIAGIPLSISTGTSTLSFEYRSDGGLTKVSLPAYCTPTVSVTAGHASVVTSSGWVRVRAAPGVAVGVQLSCG